MAAVAPLPVRTTPNHWGSDDSVAYDLDAAEHMTRVMSYQYPPPPPPQSGAEMDLHPSAFIPDYSALPPSSDLEPRSSGEANQLSLERQRSFSKSMKVKRSMSTPIVQTEQPMGSADEMGADALAGDPAALALAGEKRRNKLGYHRTSVACGHCRRRKIRCIPSPADVQGRCVNCIRLKKECSFYPVDQPPTPDTRPKAGSRSSVGPKMESASSSPALPAGMPSEMPAQAQFSQLAIGNVQSMAPPAVKSQAPENFVTEAKVSSSISTARNSFDYGHAGVTNWMSPEGNQSQPKPADLHATWRSYPAESPVNSAFSPFTPTTPASSSTWTGPVGGAEGAREDLAWSSYAAQPTRSMSFGSAEAMNAHAQQYAAMPHGGQATPVRPYDRKSGSMSEIYPSAMGTTMAGLEPVANPALEHHAALSGANVPPQAYGAWSQPYGYPKQGDGYWYGDTSDQHLGPEEQVQQATEHGQPGTNMYYSGR